MLVHTANLVSILVALAASTLAREAHGPSPSFHVQEHGTGGKHASDPPHSLRETQLQTEDSIEIFDDYNYDYYGERTQLEEKPPSRLDLILPLVTFDCKEKEGYFADGEFHCDVFHYCAADGTRFTFLCGEGSKFNQVTMICDFDGNLKCGAKPTLRRPASTSRLTTTNYTGFDNAKLQSDNSTATPFHEDTSNHRQGWSTDGIYGGRIDEEPLSSPARQLPRDTSNFPSNGVREDLSKMSSGLRIVQNPTNTDNSYAHLLRDIQHVVDGNEAFQLPALAARSTKFETSTAPASYLDEQTSPVSYELRHVGPDLSPKPFYGHTEIRSGRNIKLKDQSLLALRNIVHSKPHQTTQSHNSNDGVENQPRAFSEDGLWGKITDFPLGMYKTFVEKTFGEEQNSRKESVFPHLEDSSIVTADFKVKDLSGPQHENRRSQTEQDHKAQASSVGSDLLTSWRGSVENIPSKEDAISSYQITAASRNWPNIEAGRRSTVGRNRGIDQMRHIRRQYDLLLHPVDLPYTDHSQREFIDPSVETRNLHGSPPHNVATLHIPQAHVGFATFQHSTPQDNPSQNEQRAITLPYTISSTEAPRTRSGSLDEASYSRNPYTLDDLHPGNYIKQIPAPRLHREFSQVESLQREDESYAINAPETNGPIISSSTSKPHRSSAAPLDSAKRTSPPYFPDVVAPLRPEYFGTKREQFEHTDTDNTGDRPTQLVSTKNQFGYDTFVAPRFVPRTHRIPPDQGEQYPRITHPRSFVNQRIPSLRPPSSDDYPRIFTSSLDQRYPTDSSRRVTVPKDINRPFQVSALLPDVSGSNSNTQIHNDEEEIGVENRKETSHGVRSEFEQEKRFDAPTIIRLPNGDVSIDSDTSSLPKLFEHSDPNFPSSSQQGVSKVPIDRPIFHTDAIFHKIPSHFNIRHEPNRQSSKEIVAVQVSDNDHQSKDDFMRHNRTPPPPRISTPIPGRLIINEYETKDDTTERTKPKTSNSDIPPRILGIDDRETQTFPTRNTHTNRARTKHRRPVSHSAAEGATHSQGKPIHRNTNIEGKEQVSTIRTTIRPLATTPVSYTRRVKSRRPTRRRRPTITELTTESSRYKEPSLVSNTESPTQKTNMDNQTQTEDRKSLFRRRPTSNRRPLIGENTRSRSRARLALRHRARLNAIRESYNSNSTHPDTSRNRPVQRITSRHNSTQQEHTQISGEEAYEENKDISSEQGIRRSTNYDSKQSPDTRTTLIRTKPTARDTEKISDSDVALALKSRPRVRDSSDETSIIHRQKPPGGNSTVSPVLENVHRVYGRRRRLRTRPGGTKPLRRHSSSRRRVSANRSKLGTLLRTQNILWSKPEVEEKNTSGKEEDTFSQQTLLLGAESQVTGGKNRGKSEFLDRTPSDDVSPNKDVDNANNDVRKLKIEAGAGKIGRDWEESRSDDQDTAANTYVRGQFDLDSSFGPETRRKKTVVRLPITNERDAVLSNYVEIHTADSTQVLTSGDHSSNEIENTATSSSMNKRPEKLKNNQDELSENNDESRKNVHRYDMNEESEPKHTAGNSTDSMENTQLDNNVAPHIPHHNPTDSAIATLSEKIKNNQEADPSSEQQTMQVNIPVNRGVSETVAIQANDAPITDSRTTMPLMDDPKPTQNAMPSVQITAISSEFRRPMLPLQALFANVNN